jgi:hypothetical protein
MTALIYVCGEGDDRAVSSPTCDSSLAKLAQGSFRAGHKSIQYVIYQVSQEKGLAGFSPGVSSNERKMKAAHEWLGQVKKKPARQASAGEDMRRDKAGSRHALSL